MMPHHFFQIIHIKLYDLNTMVSYNKVLFSVIDYFKELLHPKMADI